MMPINVKTSPKIETTADRVAVVELQVELVQVREDLHAQVEHHPLTRHLHRPGLRVLECKRGKQGCQVHRGDGREAGQIASRDIAVDDDLREVRRRQLQGRVANDRRDGEDHLRAIRAQIPQQPPHEPAVVCLSQDLVVVHQDAASSSSRSCLRYRSA
jgi:hypothetical protein